MGAGARRPIPGPAQPGASRCPRSAPTTSTNWTVQYPRRRFDEHLLARRLLARVIQPRLLALRRLVIAEVGRFPELGRAFYESGPGRTIAALEAAFTRLAERGVLQLDDPRLAAEQFNWLIMSIPLNQAMLLGQNRPHDGADLDRYADGGVRVFLAAYGSAPAAGETRRHRSSRRPRGR